jgi:NADH-quinone oxidoreductase subunit N
VLRDHQNVQALLPLVAVTGAAIVVLLAAAWRRTQWAATLIGSLGLLCALVCLVPASQVAPRHATPLFALDGFALAAIGLVLGASLATTVLAQGYLRRREGVLEEFQALLLLATVGAMVLVISRSFASLFLGLETLSISLYGLIAYTRAQRDSVEAGVKYLILAGASSAFLLFGVALLYAERGSLEFAARAAVAPSPGSPLLWLAGLGLVFTGIGFKLGIVPFHLWTPDVYAGAPAPVAAFVATVSKGAVLAVLLRYGLEDPAGFRGLWPAIAVTAAASMLVGNLLALRQENLKRLLAYSSIAQLGYLLVALLALGPLGVEAAVYFLAAYFATTLLAFGVVAALSGAEHEAGALEDYRGLVWTHPGRAAALALALLSLAGIPLTGGFVGKFYVLAAGVQGALWGLVALVVATSALGLAYYLRVVFALFVRPVAHERATRPTSHALSGDLVLAVLVVLLVWLGTYPAPLMRTLRGAAAIAGAPQERVGSR